MYEVIYMARSKNIYLENDIKILELDKDIKKILNDHEIKTIGDLQLLTRKKLKEFGLKDVDIKLITIKLQLLGLDLNKKIYS